MAVYERIAGNTVRSAFLAQRRRKVLSESDFPGADKSGRSILSPLEKRFSDWLVPRLPGRLETHHLTLMTVLWCLCILLFSYLARGDIRWLWLVSAAILGQYITDHLDGKLGKYRKAGLVHWGYFMDHFLDYFFLCAILTGYAWLLPAPHRFRMFFVLVVFGGYLVLAYLAAPATGSFRVAAAGLGPTEFRLALIIINVFLICFGAEKMAAVLPYVAGGGMLVLVVLAYRAHRQIWKKDMEQKARSGAKPGESPGTWENHGQFTRVPIRSGQAQAAFLALPARLHLPGDLEVQQPMHDVRNLEEEALG